MEEPMAPDGLSIRGFISARQQAQSPDDRHLHSHEVRCLLLYLKRKQRGLHRAAKMVSTSLFLSSKGFDPTCEAHWHREEARPERTEATRTGIIPLTRIWLGPPPPLLPPLAELSPMLRSMAAIISRPRAPICFVDCLWLQITQTKVSGIRNRQHRAGYFLTWILANAWKVNA